MSLTVHNPDQYMASLRQIIGQGRKRIGLLVGAGAPAGILMGEPGVPLIPAVAGLTELVLKAGFPLTVEVVTRDVDGCAVFDVDKGRMWAALDKVTPAVFQAAAEARPSVFVTLSGLFAGKNGDEIMANANLQLKDAGVDFKVI